MELGESKRVKEGREEGGGVGNVPATLLPRLKTGGIALFQDWFECIEKLDDV